MPQGLDLMIFLGSPKSLGECLWLLPRLLKPIILLFLHEANEGFVGSGINTITNGQCHLGAAIRKRAFMEEYVKAKVSQWTTEVKQLASIAKTQPLAAISAFTHGLSIAI